MDIQYAILGLLNWRPCSGYEIKKIISESDLFYWSGNNNQIYYGLIQLHQSGLVTQSVEQQESLPAKKIYSITPDGKQRLREWSMCSPEMPDVKMPFLIQLAWTDDLSDEELDTLLDQYETELKVQVQMLEEQSNRRRFKPDRNPREVLIWSRMEEHLLTVWQQEFEWVKRLRAELRVTNTGKKALSKEGSKE